MNELTRLSSNSTVIYKCILPIFLLAVLGYGAIFSPLRQSSTGILLVGLWIIVLLSYIAHSFHLKMVWIGKNHLIVSNFLKKIIVPLHMIMDIKKLNVGNVAIIMKGDTEFGNKIVFMPCQPLVDILNRWSESDSVTLLQAKLDEYRGRPSKQV